MSPWKVILATMVIFCCGVVTGAMVITRGHFEFEHARGPGRPMGFPANAAQRRNTNFLGRMDKDLVLTPDQHTRIEAIMHESEDRNQLLWDTINPALQKEMNRMHQEIQDVLTPEQQVKFEELMQSRRKMEGGPGRGTNRMHTNGFPSNFPPRFDHPPGAFSNNFN